MAPTEQLSKSRINRAGKRWSKHMAAYFAGGPSARDLPADEYSTLVQDVVVLDKFRDQHAYPLRMANANLRYYVRGFGDGPVVTQRLKKLSTVLDKLERHPTMQLANMEDIGGVRAVLPDQAAADAVSRRLRKNWKIHRYRDYVRAPKESGYRALHLIVVKKNCFIEVQLRTVMQDEWANQVEHDSRALRVDFKGGAGANEVHGYYRAVSELLAANETGVEPTDEFMAELVRLYRLAVPYLASARGS